MLTSELLRVVRRGEQLVPRYLRGASRARLLPVAERLIATLQAAMGERREDVEAALDGVEHGPADRVVVQGLRKLLLDRCELAVAAGADPAELRACVFRHAAAAHRGLGPREVFDRDTVLTAAAGELGVAAADVAARLFADLRGNERLLSFRPIEAEALLERYDVALAQGVLLRATRVEVALLQETAGEVRSLFRAARFHGLLHRVRRLADGGYVVELDGPLSLFGAVQRYGLELALFLPAVLRCRRWRLRADVLWTKRKQPALFELGPDSGLVPHGRRAGAAAPKIDELVAGFRALGTPWDVAHNHDIMALPGEAVCVPDLVFDHRGTGERVYLEAFGFWSRQAVWQRVETIRRGGFPGRIILAVSKQLRVSREVLDEDAAGELYVYKTAMRPKAILDRLDAALPAR